MATQAQGSGGWRNSLPEGVSPTSSLLRSPPCSSAFPRAFRSLCLAATLTQRLVRSGHREEIDLGLRARAADLQLQMGLGPAGRPDQAARIEEIRSAADLAVVGRHCWSRRAVAVLGFASPQADIQSVVIGAFCSALPARRSTSSSTPIASRCSSRDSSASDRACRNMAGAWAPSLPPRSRCSSRRGPTGPSVT